MKTPGFWRRLLLMWPEWVARRLPRSVAYACVESAVHHASDGPKWFGTNPTADDVLDRFWEDRDHSASRSLGGE